MSDKPKIPSLFDRLSREELVGVNDIIGGKYTRPTVNEYAFKNRYLPMLYNFFTQEIGVDEISKYRTIWIQEVAGHGTKEVDVVNSVGAVIAVVPPVYGSIQYINKDKSVSLSSVMKTCRDIRTHRGEVRADEHFKQVFNNANIKMSSPVMERWVGLFTQFNCFPKPAANSNTDTGVKGSGLTFSDDEDATYEP